MTNHGTHETRLEWHGFTAIWLNPDGKLRDFTPGVSRFLKDAEEIVPESKGNWFIIEENSTDAEVIASAISTSKVPGTRKVDGSPVYSEGVSGEAYLDGDPDNFESDNFLGRFSLDRDVDLAEQQTFDLILHRSTFPMLSELVRSAAKHLHPDYISGINIAFNQDMINARTASWNAVPLVGLVSWIRDLHPHELAGYPVTNIEEYEGGLYFEAISDQAGTTLAQLADHLEHIGTRHALGLLPEHSNSVWPNRPGAPTPPLRKPNLPSLRSRPRTPRRRQPPPRLRHHRPPRKRTPLPRTRLALRPRPCHQPTPPPRNLPHRPRRLPHQPPRHHHRRLGPTRHPPNRVHPTHRPQRMAPRQPRPRQPPPPTLPRPQHPHPRLLPQPSQRMRSEPSARPLTPARTRLIMTGPAAYATGDYVDWSSSRRWSGRSASSFMCGPGLPCCAVA